MGHQAALDLRPSPALGEERENLYSHHLAEQYPKGQKPEKSLATGPAKRKRDPGSKKQKDKVDTGKKTFRHPFWRGNPPLGERDFRRWRL